MSKLGWFWSLLLWPIFAFAHGESAIFAGGCFWYLQADFDKLPGVLFTTVGYDGGNSKSTRVESVKVDYNANKITYPQLLDYFWHHVDPTTAQYRTAIFYLNTAQKNQALASLQEVRKKFPVVYAKVLPSINFYSADDCQQEYHQKSPLHYDYYRWHSGRDAKIHCIWCGK